MMVTFMRYLRTIFKFGWPYLQRHFGRFMTGVLLAVFFGLTNGVLVLAVKVTTERLKPEEPAIISAATEETPKAKFSTFDQWRRQAQDRAMAVADPWLPRAGRALDWRQIVVGILFFPVLAALRGFSGYVSSYCFAWVTERVINDLRVDVMKKLMTLSLDFFNRTTSGDLLARVQNDAFALHRCLILGLSDLIKEPILVLATVAGLCFINWQLTLGALVFVPLCLIPILILGRKVKNAAKAGLAANITQSSLLIEVISSIRVVKAFSLGERLTERFAQLSREQILHNVRGTRARELMNPVVEVLSMICFGALIVFITYRQEKLEDVVSLLVGVGLIYQSVKKLAGIHALFQAGSVGVERLVQIMSEQPTVREPVAVKPLAQFQSAIVFGNVSFAYGTKPVLQNVDLMIPRGFKLGIAGESGSGKSTLVNLIFRFYDPVSGAVRIDGADLREITSQDLHRQMALVSQEVVIFDQTVAENIACGKENATREEIESAACAAFAHDFIVKLPEGYDTRLGERGVTLSGGQRQRVCIARAFIRNAPILVLDEATASLDSQSEAEVQTAIDRLAENRTVICIAHRLSTLKDMDRIVVINNGRIVEQGTFQELLQADSRFAAMARKQGMIGNS
jgi:ABC-type multidrug transport system fused ATPase/permease subunit